MFESKQLIDFFVLQGVPYDTVILLLMFPLVATLVAFFQQVIGVKAFGIYTPSIVTFALFAMNDLKYGLAVFLTVIVVGMLVRYGMKRLRILYLSRVAITLTIVSIAVLISLAIGGHFQRTGLAAVSIFPLLIMIMLVEKFVAAQIEQGLKQALLLAGKTLVISVAGFYLLKWQFLVGAVSNHPWIVLLTFPFNILIGRWTGLRVSEYLRFREVFKHL